MGLKMAYQLPIVCGSPALTFRASVDDGQGGTLAFCNGEIGGGTRRYTEIYGDIRRYREP